ncbi:RNA polymerase sigma factor [Marinimicrobium alkaliphilum]|uniref:RNA polymerase sigma factor n=1 Tax=Marinimicrobium alkaliphilum TaxID=2202654 RepID=UPI000DB9FFFC|nr:sigma-70 family RNA polymerase sigma factor [Marinimicrobium alkaliphilum]
MTPRDTELVNLIARCAIRDQAALGALFERLGGYLNAIAYRILQSDELCEEVLQDAFVQIWQNAHRYRPDQAAPLTWITSILRYRALDRRDKEQRLQRHLSSAEVDPPSTEAPLEQQVERHQTRARIEHCLAALNPRTRDCIRLAYLEGYTREELAQRLDTTLNTVKSWLRRGGRALRQCLEENVLRR